MNAVILDHNIDTSFITQLEQRNDHYKFMRIDADLTEDVYKRQVINALLPMTAPLPMTVSPPSIEAPA